MPRQPKIPTYRLHKPTGKAVVTLSGRDYYLGPYGTRTTSPESWAEYDRLVAEWLAAGRRLQQGPPDLTVEELLSAYWEHVQVYYRKPGGEPSSQVERVRLAVGPLRDLYGPTSVKHFGPLALKAVRQEMIRRGWARGYINSCVGCIKRAFAWAVSEEMIASNIYEALRTVQGLQRGRCEAKESRPMTSAPEAAIEAVRREVLPVVRALIDFQLLTAARPGEACNLRPCDLDRSGPVWVYRPASHKTAHRGHDRRILVGPRCQELLAPFLLRPADQYCFCPREAVAAWLEAEGKTVRLRESRTPGDRYEVTSYDRAIAKACARADRLARERAQEAGPLPAQLTVPGAFVPHWSPHQLRHNAATRLVAEFGWDVARIILGHRSLDATRIYGEDNLKRAVEVIGRVG